MYTIYIIIIMLRKVINLDKKYIEDIYFKSVIFLL